MPDSTARRATIITSLNLKSGVGKTHACLLIAGVCQERNRKRLVLDLDKQGNISIKASTKPLCRQVTRYCAKKFSNPEREL
ncbi:MAG: AAA family ATPase [Planctomycetaceae bacterium]